MSTMPRHSALRAVDRALWKRRHWVQVRDYCILLAVAAVFTFFLAGCGGGGDDGQDRDPNHLWTDENGRPIVNHCRDSYEAWRECVR